MNTCPFDFNDRSAAQWLHFVHSVKISRPQNIGCMAPDIYASVLCRAGRLGKTNKLRMADKNHMVGKVGKGHKDCISEVEIYSHKTAFYTVPHTGNHRHTRDVTGKPCLLRIRVESQGTTLGKQRRALLVRSQGLW